MNGAWDLVRAAAGDRSGMGGGDSRSRSFARKTRVERAVPPSTFSWPRCCRKGTEAPWERASAKSEYRIVNTCAEENENESANVSVNVTAVGELGRFWRVVVGPQRSE